MFIVETTENKNLKSIHNKATSTYTDRHGRKIILDSNEVVIELEPTPVPPTPPVVPTGFGQGTYLFAGLTVVSLLASLILIKTKKKLG